VAPRRQAFGVAAAVIVAALVIGFTIGRSTASTNRPSSSSSTTAAPVTTSTVTLPGVQVGPFDGVWYHHGFGMTVSEGGYGTFNWRTYTSCGAQPAPCDYNQGNEIIDGGYAVFSLESNGPTSASGHVFETDDARVVPFGPFTVKFHQRDDMVFVSFANGQLAMCGPKAAPPASEQCGA